MKGTTASDEMNRVLDRIAGDIPGETNDTKGFLTDDERNAGYRRCTWWNGCYYCQSADGTWELIKCIA